MDDWHSIFLFIRFCSFSAVSGRSTNGSGKRIVGLVSGVEGDLPGNDDDDYTGDAQRRSVRQHTKPIEASRNRQLTQTSLVLRSVLPYVCVDAQRATIESI
jgi:hypothetical protein